MRLFYRGDLDDSKTEAPNGAVVNEAYLRFITDGAWGEAKLHAVRDGVWTIVGLSLSNWRDCSVSAVGPLPRPEGRAASAAR